MNVFETVLAIGRGAVTEFTSRAWAGNALRDTDLTDIARTRLTTLVGGIDLRTGGTVLALRAFEGVTDTIDVFEPEILNLGAIVRLAGSGLAPADVLGNDRSILEDPRGAYVMRPGDVLHVPYTAARVIPFCGTRGLEAFATRPWRLVLSYGFAHGNVSLPRDRAPLPVRQTYTRTFLAGPLGQRLTKANLAVGPGASVVLATADPARRDLMVQNHGADPLAVEIGAPAVFGSTPIVLDAFQSVPFRAWGLRVTDSVEAIRAGGAAVADVGVVETE